MASEYYSRRNLNINNSAPESDKEKFRLNTSYFEGALIKLFIIDLRNLIKTKMSLAKHYNVQPSEIDRMSYWEFEDFLSDVNEDIKEENKRNEDENGKYKNMNPNSMMRQAQKGMPKMPSIPTTPKMPSVSSMPK